MKCYHCCFRSEAAVIKSYSSEMIDREALTLIMSRKKVDVMLLQETWSPDPAGRWITPTGYLFLLHRAPRKADSGRRTCGVGFVLSPSAVDAWEAAGAPFVDHPSSDGCARLASI